MKEKRCQVCRKALEVLGLLVIAGNLFLIGLVIVWLLQVPNISSVEEPIPVLNEGNEITIGETIVLELHIDKPLDSDQLLTTDSNITCNDNNLVTLADITTVLPSGEQKWVLDQYELPPKVAVGSECQINLLNEYRQNPLKTTKIKWSSETFIVKGKHNE